MLLSRCFRVAWLVLLSQVCLVCTALAQTPTNTLLQVKPGPVQGRNAPLVVQFRQPIIAPEQVGTSADAYVHLTPETVGQARFSGRDTITFTAAEPLRSGQSYTLQINTQKLPLLALDMASLGVSFSTPKMAIDLSVLGLSASADAQMQLSGTVFSSDFLATEQLADVLQAHYDDGPLPVTFSSNFAGDQHQFTVAGIARGETEKTLDITWQGTAIGAVQSGSKSLVVPARAQFALTQVKVLDPLDESSDRHIALTFSDRLDPNQNLQGLVLVGGKAAQLQIVENRILVYPSELKNGRHDVVVYPGIAAAKAGLGKLQKRHIETLEWGAATPAVRFVGRGNILPEGQGLIVPIEARAVNSVDVIAFEIGADKIEQFLQTNSLDGDEDLGRVGRYLWRKTLPLDGAADRQRWMRYNLDVSDLIATRPGALYRLQVELDPRHVATGCPSAPTPALPHNPVDDESSQSSGWDGIEQWGAQDESDSWSQRKNPCYAAFYTANKAQTQDARNIFASDIGLIAKRAGNGALSVIASRISSAEPLADVQLQVRDYQGRQIANGQTDVRGFSTLSLGEQTPFLLLATKGEQTAYLKLNNATALSVSQFEVGGNDSGKTGLDGHLFAERGVWRPGDELFVTFVLENRAAELPAEHPLTVQLLDPRGKVRMTRVSNQPVGPFYPFTLKTDEEDPTGTWLVRASFGGAVFERSLLIDHVRPNRLKIELDYDTPILHGYAPLPKAKLFAQWLHGASAAGLKADVHVRLREKTTRFDRYSDFTFDDPARSLDSSRKQIFNAALDKKGRAQFVGAFQPESPAPGMLSAWFTSRVHETGGGFSIARQAMDYTPFAHYVGLKLPKGDRARGMLLTDVRHRVSIATVDAEGRDVSLRSLQVSLYKIDWKYWWDKTPESLAEYAQATHSQLLQQERVRSQAGKASWSFEIKYPDWGRYLIRACDLKGKHCTGKVLYVDWPGWAGRAQEQGGGGAAAMLQVGTDKARYQVGDTAQINLPQINAGRALLTLENGSEILQQRWLQMDGTRQQVALPVTADMAPNAYVSVSVLQPHSDKNNDRPIRLYGVAPLLVDDPQTHLTPQIVAADEWRPAQAQSFQVREQSGRAMSYVLAVVDEGLLGLTRHQTDDLHKVFYRKQALGVQTWDLYDSVIGSYSAELARVLAIGGGDEVALDDAAFKPKRFPPLVRFLGAFELAAGASATHEVSLPNYLGAVRIMLVAADAQTRAYGRAEQSVFVRQPLMLQAALPQKMKTGETLQMPITLFSSASSTDPATLAVTSGDLIADVAPVAPVSFNQPGEQTTSTQLRVGEQAGTATLQLQAKMGAHESTQTVNLPIVYANPETTQSTQLTVAANSVLITHVNTHGMAGTNYATLEASRLPDLSLSRHLDYLIQYPHGCLEQTVSAAFPQLYLPKIMIHDDAKLEKIEQAVQAAIENLEDFQNSEGDFNYWPQGSSQAPWASVYAGQFLTQAKAAGYLVPALAYQRYLSAQYALAQNWQADFDADDTLRVQAYRLMMLAEAGRPALGAMNRLREQVKDDARWLLAHAYLSAGHQRVAEQLVLDRPYQVASQARAFSGDLGALGQRVRTLLALGRRADAAELVAQISATLIAKPSSTHDTAWALLGLADYLGDDTDASMQFSVAKGAAAALSGSGQAYQHYDLGAVDEATELTLRNTGETPLSVTLTQRGTAALGQEVASEQGLAVEAQLLDASGALIWQSHSNGLRAAVPRIVLNQGGDYTLKVTLYRAESAPLSHLAMTLPLPSGAELGRTEGGGAISYMDRRDDRVMAYIDEASTPDAMRMQMTFNAAFQGDYYLGGILAEAMYQPAIAATAPGVWVQIISTRDSDG